MVEANLVITKSKYLHHFVIKANTIKLLLLVVLNLGLSGTNGFAQAEESDSVKVRRFDIFPAISYSPETKLTLGALGYWYLNLANKDPETMQSYINFLALYTTANQVIVETNWDIFTDGNKMRFQGALEFTRFPNKNYGLGNNADARVMEYELFEGNAIDSTLYNYKRYSIMRFNFRPGVLWELSNNLYGGVIADIEYVWNFEELADSINITQGKADIDLLENNTLGLRSGLGLNLIWDTRDYLLSSSSGSYFYLSGKYYGAYLGSKYSYYSILLDARTYLNPVGRHTLAIRGLLNFKGTKDETIPLRGLARVGGANILRGYFSGTFQHNNFLVLETEYRIPFWKEDNLGPIYKFWQRLAMTVFAGGAQVFGPTENFDAANFNFAAGAGLRILFNEQSRSYLRVDYGFGLSPNAGGPDQFQRGLYFTFGEAF
jgi:outer membrane protein assembly factor BamA